MVSLQTHAARFIALLRSGQTELAMEEFYDEEVLVFENRELARAGKQACLAYERRQLATQSDRPHFKLTAHAVNETTGHVFLQYTVRFTDATGRPMRLEEVAVQTWETDKIVQERFYYEGVVDEGDSADQG